MLRYRIVSFLTNFVMFLKHTSNVVETNKQTGRHVNSYLLANKYANVEGQPRANRVPTRSLRLRVNLLRHNETSENEGVRTIYT